MSTASRARGSDDSSSQQLLHVAVPPEMANKPDSRVNHLVDLVGATGLDAAR